MTAADTPPCLKVVMEIFLNAVDISKKQGNYQFTGPVVTVLDIIQNHLGMCFQLMMSKHRVYGYQQSNGSWTGLIGILQRQEVDFAGTLFQVTPERLASLELSEPLYIDEYNSLYVLPGVVPDMTNFIKPYTPLVWLLVFLATLMVLGVSHAVLRHIAFPSECQLNGRSKLFISGDLLVSEGDGLQLTTGKEQKEVAADQSQRTVEPLWSIKRSTIWIWGILLSQSVPWMPSKNLARGVAAVWLLMSFILASIYRSNLKAMIIYPRIHLPFSSLEELSDSNILTLVVSGSALHTHIMSADNSSSLGRLKDQINLFHSGQISSATQDVLNGRAVGISYAMNMLSIMDGAFSLTNKCNLYTMSRGFLGPMSLSLAFPKGSPLRRSFDQIIIRLRESGILAKLFSDGLVNSTKCVKPMGLFLTTAEGRPFRLEDFYGVFLVYAAGLLLATGLFLGEFIRGGRRSRIGMPSGSQPTKTSHFVSEL